MSDKILNIILAGVVVAILITALFVLYGHLTQHDTITVRITDKNIEYSKVCDENRIHCTTTSRYKIYSSKEEFSISKNLYRKITAGKKHTIYVSGWPGARHVWKVLE